MSLYIDDFKSIEPFLDDNINEALKRITSAKEFSYMSSFVFPESKSDDVIALLHSIHTADDFQKKFMHRAVRRVVETSSDGLSYDGFDKLNPNTPYLFIANHRDIVLDSAILQVLLVEHNIPTTEITLGNNLMISPFIIDFAKVNKMFTVIRGGSRADMLRNTKLLSAYIRYAIKEKHTSVWIAQRNGRTKDGFDKTEEALLKMLNLSGTGSLIENFNELNIVPLTISYEFEPCATFKAYEIYKSQFEIYKKMPGEDFKSIINGFTQPKGRIHLSAGTPIYKDVSQLEGGSNYSAFIKSIAQIIDNAIYGNYKLWKTNYIAYDLLNNSLEFAHLYTEEEKDFFVNFVNKEIASLNIKDELFKRMYLKIFANPVINRLHLKNKNV